MQARSWPSLLETETLPSPKFCAECQKSGTRQTLALGKGLLCRVPDSRQNLYTRHRLPVKTASGHGLLCRAPAVRHSAKICFFLNFFTECPRSGTRQRFNFFLKKILCRASQIWRSAMKIFLFLKYFAECTRDGTRQRFNIFYYFFAECSCGCTRQRGNLKKN